jgi:hypothetical protein
VHRIINFTAFIIILCFTGCASTPRVMLHNNQTADHLGSAQGIEVRDGFVYLYGDTDTGVIREYSFKSSAAGRQLTYTGREIKLTQQGRDLIAHPTGLTHHQRFGTFLGDTVRGQGVIYLIDWQQALDDGNLDRAVLNACRDDLAVNGTRPEFVEIEGAWYIATSDYGDAGNYLRLYDPAVLATAQQTSDQGVLVAAHACGPFVQSIAWIPQDRLIALVQNKIAGLQYRLTFLEYGNVDLRGAEPFDELSPEDELEGFHLLEDGQTAILLSSSPQNNVWIGEYDS